MVFGLFKKKCPICDKEIEKGQGTARFNKQFCNEEHAEEFHQKLEKEKSKPKKGGCCG